MIKEYTGRRKGKGTRIRKKPYEGRIGREYCNMIERRIEKGIRRQKKTDR